MKPERKLSAEQAEELLQTAQVCTLCTIEEDGSPYAVPLQFLWREGRLYFHGARIGRKVQNMRGDSRVCECI